MLIVQFVFKVCVVLAMLQISAVSATTSSTQSTWEAFLDQLKVFWSWWKIQGSHIDSFLATILAIAGVLAFLWGIRKFWKARKKNNAPDELNSSLATSSPSYSLKELDDCYYTELSKRSDRYDLGSFRDSHAVSEQTTAHANLSDVYVDLMAHPVEKPSENNDEKNHLENISKQASKLLLEILQDKSLNRIVLRGDVGSGKSSVINYLSYSIVASRQGRESLPATPDHWLRRPVVRLLLREVGSQIKQDNPEEQLISFIRQRSEEHISQQLEVDEQKLHSWWVVFWKNFKKNGVLILDGLDEVSGSHEKPEDTSRRQVLLNAVNEFSQNRDYGQISVIITSRNHAYDGDDALPGFKLFQLDSLNYNGRDAVFIRHWYEKVAFDQAEQDSAKNDARELINNIAKHASLGALTQTPLLLTLILVLDKAEVGLPDSRSELYENAVNLLLDRWNKQLLNYAESLSEEEQSGIQVLKQDVGILRDALKELAYNTYANEKDTQNYDSNNQDRSIVFPISAVNQELTEQLENLPGLSIAHIAACRYFLSFRCQILVAVSDQLSFVHKSFHEYLAAAKIMDDSFDREDRLLAMANNSEERDWWQKVFLFALNTQNASYVMKLMQTGVLSKQLGTMSDETDLANHIDKLSLFSRAALENKLESEVSKKGNKNLSLLEAYKELQKHITLLWERDDLTVIQRAQLGRIAGRCGDMRQGIAFKRNDDYMVQYHRTDTTAFPIPEFDWKEIQAGEFMMGEEGDDGSANEKPALLIQIKNTFHMASSAVTNAQYQSFIDAGGYSDESIWKALPDPAYQWWLGGLPGLSLVDSFPEKIQETIRQTYKNDKERKQPRDWQATRRNISNHPVVGVSWFEALAYIEWLNRNKVLVLPKALLGQDVNISLPREDQWEYAARGEASLTYAWGSEEDSSKGNVEETKIGRANAAGVFNKGQAFGLYDMSGNIWEWTTSRWGQDIMSCSYGYGEDYLEGRLIQNDLNPIEFRVIRGGSWSYSVEESRCSTRLRLHPNARYDFLGFRLVCAPP